MQGVSPPGTFTRISAGNTNSCGITPNGQVQCWGDDTLGRSTPPAGNYKQISVGGAHSCAVRANNTVVCWGYNTTGQATPPAQLAVL